MATIVNFLRAILLLSIISKGYCQCPLQQVTISQAQTGLQVQNKPEWKVTISNGCPCSQLNLKLSCKGFQTVRNIDPSVLAKSGDECLINSGAPVAPKSTFTFTYAWDSSFPFKPLSSQIACS